ncbi:MAG: hypothetical protein WBO71_15785 [Thermoanaerobaculia bacterium]
MNTRAKELDRKFDVGEDITRYLDLSKPRRPGHEQRRVNVDFPNWMIESLTGPVLARVCRRAFGRRAISI